MMRAASRINAFYTVTSMAPVLLIVIAIGGLAFGREAAQNAITTQLSKCGLLTKSTTGYQGGSGEASFSATASSGAKLASREVSSLWKNGNQSLIRSSKCCRRICHE
jgi:uncharacterized BrkB/YihY/UPF0761 family membrane protein